MKSRNNTSGILIGALLAITGSAGAQPPDVVASDTDGNTAMGTSALISTISGLSFGDTAAGFQALFLNTIGSDNTAIGSGALGANTSGSRNTATGTVALNSSTTGNDNTAFGFEALFSNSSGSYNTASGHDALYSNTTGYRNEASGAWALISNTTGHDNTATGHDALHFTTSGSNNVGVGANAGYYVTTGSNNIQIGSLGKTSDNATVRIGTQGTQTATYIAGINSAHVTGSAVYISSTGQLGVLASSESYKTSIAPMGASSQKLHQLRPVTFKLKSDPRGLRQYGLIAEEVANVYPELVIRDEKGRVEGIRYEELAPMLLNEVQEQAAQLRDLKREVAELKATRAGAP